MLAPDPSGAIQQLTAIFNSANHITRWAETLVNAVLPPMSPEPSWYQSINAALASSQQHAQSWLNTTSPNIIAEMSDAFISYSSKFGNIAGDAIPILKQISAQNGTPTAPQTQTLVELFTVAQQLTAANQQTVNTLSAAMAGYRTDMQADSAALKAALKAALPAEAKARALVQQIQTEIQSAEITLAADVATATADDIDDNSALSSLAVGMTFALTFDPVGFGIALLGLGSSIVISAEAEAQVEADIAQIQKFAAELGPAEIQLGLLQGIVSNLESLSSNVQSAIETFDDFDDTWTFANFGVSYLLVVLAQPQINTALIPDLNDLPKAIAAWQQMSAFASKVLNLQITPQTPITISAQPGSLAAAI